MIKQDVDRLEEKLDKVIDLLQGKEGLIVEVDRLKQSEKRRVWWTRTAIGASITAVVTAAAAMLGFKS